MISIYFEQLATELKRDEHTASTFGSVGAAHVRGRRVQARFILSNMKAPLWHLAAVVACSSGDAVTSATGPSDPVPATVTVTLVTDTIRVGEQVTVYATLRDSAGGILIDRNVAWTSTNPAVAVVSVSGSVTGLAPGSSTIVATSGRVSGSATVLVYAPAVSSIIVTPPIDTLFTFQHVTLSTLVRDQMLRWIREPQSVTWSSSYPSVADVDTAGKVTGVSPGSSTITATIGRVSATATIVVRIAPTPAGIDGDWTMTLSPSPGCRDKFPAIARERQYLVQFTQDGADFRLTISAPTLEVANAGENGGSLVGTTIRFVFVGDTEYGGWSSTDLHDHLSDTETLDFDGSVVGVVSGSEIVATMSGDVEYWNGPRSFSGPTVGCRAADHVLRLQR